eukprot:11575703-Alexandrium_andersonii.AAC.1
MPKLQSLTLKLLWDETELTLRDGDLQLQQHLDAATYTRLVELAKLRAGKFRSAVVAPSLLPRGS